MLPTSTGFILIGTVKAFTDDINKNKWSSAAQHWQRVSEGKYWLKILKFRYFWTKKKRLLLASKPTGFILIGTAKAFTDDINKNKWSSASQHWQRVSEGNNRQLFQNTGTKISLFLGCYWLQNPLDSPWLALSRRVWMISTRINGRQLHRIDRECLRAFYQLNKTSVFLCKIRLLTTGFTLIVTIKGFTNDINTQKWLAPAQHWQTESQAWNLKCTAGVRNIIHSNAGLRIQSSKKHFSLLILSHFHENS